MKAEFELTVDEETGEPKIVFLYHDRDKSIEQKLLGVFVRQVKENGIILENPSGYLEAGTSNSYERYEIKIRSHVQPK